MLMVMTFRGRSPRFPRELVVDLDVYLPDIRNANSVRRTILDAPRSKCNRCQDGISHTSTSQNAGFYSGGNFHRLKNLIFFLTSTVLGHQLAVDL